MSIRNDATRHSIPVVEPRPLRSVAARQGQVLLDTDVNEAGRLLIDRIESADAAMLGPTDRLLYPAGTTAFQIGGAAPNFTIGAGGGYLAGWQLVNAAADTLATQPRPWDGAAPALPCALALKALVRHIDPAEEPALADVALGDAQASGRTLIDWQVFPFPVPAGTTCEAVTGLAAWQALVAPSSGTLAFALAAAAPSTDPCSLTPSGGQTTFENLFYRIEVHNGVATENLTDGPRFGLAGLKLKFSRRNASLMARITQVNGVQFTVSPPALDPRAWFAQGSYAEIVAAGDDIDPFAALAHERLFAIGQATDETVTLTAAAADVAATGVNAGGSWFLRLWDAFPDGTGVTDLPAGGGSVDLGDGISITLAPTANATFRRGDSWTAPVRADGSLVWPGINQPIPTQRPPLAPVIRYAPLAIATTGGLADCRIPFATLTDRSLLYRGGDGQSVFAPPATAATQVKLPQQLRVAVMRGATPVPGASVAFGPIAGEQPGWINTQAPPVAGIVVTTDVNGLANVDWSIDAAQQAAVFGIQATLLSGANPAATPPVQFNARFETAAQTSYQPGACTTLDSVTDVQTALDTLCKAIQTETTPSLILKQITLTSSTKAAVQLIDKDSLILNALEVNYDAFVDGVQIDTSAAALSSKLQAYDPAVEISLDLPYPTTDYDRLYWQSAITFPQVLGVAFIPPPKIGFFGFHTLRLDGNLAVSGGTITWTPSLHAQQMLSTAPHHGFGAFISPVLANGQAQWDSTPIQRVLCRIRIRSALIFADDPNGQRLWLNAGHLGTSAEITGRELLLGQRENSRSGDLDMFLWVKAPEPGIVFYFGKGAAGATSSNLGTVDAAASAALSQSQLLKRPLQLLAKSDDPGTAAVNLELSQARGKQVEDLLVAKGIAATAISVVATGNTQPTWPPLTPDADQSLNRRVEVNFIAVG